MTNVGNSGVPTKQPNAHMFIFLSLTDNTEFLYLVKNNTTEKYDKQNNKTEKSRVEVSRTIVLTQLSGSTSTKASHTMLFSALIVGLSSTDVESGCDCIRQFHFVGQLSPFSVGGGPVLHYSLVGKILRGTDACSEFIYSLSTLFTGTPRKRKKKNTGHFRDKEIISQPNVAIRYPLTIIASHMTPRLRNLVEIPSSTVKQRNCPMHWCF